jgi:hypothetical protein
VEGLSGPTARPVDLEKRNAAGCAESDRQFQRIAAEAASRRNMPVNRLGFVPRRNDLNSRADGGAVGPAADEFQRQPPVVMSGVLEEHIVVLVAGGDASRLDEDVDVAVTSENVPSPLFCNSEGRIGKSSHAPRGT